MGQPCDRLDWHYRWQNRHMYMFIWAYIHTSTQKSADPIPSFRFWSGRKNRSCKIETGLLCGDGARVVRFFARDSAVSLFCFVLFCFVLFFPIPFTIFALLFSLPPSRNSDPGSHTRLFPPPAHSDSCLALLSREDFRSSLVDSRRIELGFWTQKIKKKTSWYHKMDEISYLFGPMFCFMKT